MVWRALIFTIYYRVTIPRGSVAQIFRNAFYLSVCARENKFVRWQIMTDTEFKISENINIVRVYSIRKICPRLYVYQIGENKYTVFILKYTSVY